MTARRGERTKKTGRFVPGGTAKKHPGTTVTEPRKPKKK